MKRILQATAVLAIACVLASPSQAIVYDVNRTVGTATVTGWISTDGTIGVLDDANITDFSLLLDDGTFSLTISQANGGTHLIASGNAFPGPANGSPLVATGTQLLFDFESTGFAHFQLDPLDTGTPFWCLTGSQSTPHCVGTLGHEIVKTSKDANVSYSVALDGRIVVAQARIPEPATLGVFGLGLAGLGFACRRGKKTARAISAD